MRARPIPEVLHVDEETKDPVPVIGHPATWLTNGFEGMARLAQLGNTALANLVASCPRLQHPRIGLFVALPADFGRNAAQDRGDEDESGQAKTPQELGQAMVALLLEQVGVTLPGKARLFFEERHGATLALLQAMEALWRREHDHALVMACDSLVDPGRSERLLRAGRLKTTDNPVGFMPGEAGIAILLERLDVVRSPREAPPLVLFEPGTALEPGNFAARLPSTGIGLPKVIRAALTAAAAREASSGSLYVDLNGQNHRANDWGLALVRTMGDCQIAAWSTYVPAMSFGETGTASPLLALCLAARAFLRGYSKGQHALILSASDDAHRAGMVLQFTSAPRRNR